MMDWVQPVERLGSLALLAALGWYMVTRMWPKTVEMFHEAQTANTVALQGNTEAIRKIASEGREDRQQLASILNELTKRIQEHHASEDARDAGFQSLLHEVLEFIKRQDGENH